MEAAPRVADAPLQMEALLPALAEGNGFTVMVTELELVQPLEVIVSVKV